MEEKENSEFNPVALRLKLTLCRILLMKEGLDKYILAVSVDAVFSTNFLSLILIHL